MLRILALAAALAALGAAAAHANAPYGGLPRRALLGAAVTDTPAGVHVSAVAPGSAAAQVGLAAGDLVVAVADRPVATSGAFVAAIRATPPGGRAELHLMRAGQPLALTARLHPAPMESDPGLVTDYGALPVDGTLRRTLTTLPADARGRRLPALLLIGGIGCFSIDVGEDPGDAYLRLTHDLGRRGILTLRLEKSGVGDSQGPPCAQTDLAAEERSYAVALEALRKDPRVDPTQVFLLGHSIGSLIAPRLSAHAPVAGVVAAEAVGRNWIEYELPNLRRQLVLGGDPPALVDQKMAAKERCMHRLLIDKQDEAAIERAEPDCKRYNRYPAPADYLRQAAAINIAEAWSKVAAPVLVIYGGADYVTDIADHKRIVDIVSAAHPGAAAMAVIPGMNHTLGAAGSPEAAYKAFDQGVREPYETRFSQAVAAWICARATCRPG